MTRRALHFLYHENIAGKIRYHTAVADDDDGTGGRGVTQTPVRGVSGVQVLKVSSLPAQTLLLCTTAAPGMRARVGVRGDFVVLK